jgi:hypothetical protein
MIALGIIVVFYYRLLYLHQPAIMLIDLSGVLPPPRNYFDSAQSVRAAIYIGHWRHLIFAHPNRTAAGTKTDLAADARSRDHLC